MSIAQAIRDQTKEDVIGNIGELAVSATALSKFLKIGESVDFWHLCQKEQVKALHENDKKLVSGYLKVDFQDKLSKALSGELVMAKMSGEISSNRMLSRNTRRIERLVNGEEVREIDLGSSPILDGLDRKKAELAAKLFLKEELLAEFGKEFSGLPSPGQAVSQSEFIRDWWSVREFRLFADGKSPGKFNIKAVELGDAFLSSSGKAIRELFVSEPVDVGGYRIKELYATPNAKKWLSDRLPHFKVVYISPKQFGLLS
jgi:hypothetical protein